MKNSKQLALFLFALLVFTSPISASATMVNHTSNNLSYIESPTDTSLDKAIIYCEKRPNFKHEARARGIGKLVKKYSNGTKVDVFTNGCAWQCRYCTTVIVTQYDKGRPLGYYATFDPGYVTSMVGTILVTSPENIKHTTGTTVPGFTLVKA